MSRILTVKSPVSSGVLPTFVPSLIGFSQTCMRSGKLTTSLVLVQNETTSPFFIESAGDNSQQLIKESPAPAVYGTNASSLALALYEWAGIPETKGPPFCVFTI